MPKTRRISEAEASIKADLLSEQEGNGAEHVRYPPSKIRKKRWKTTPAKLDPVTVFYLPQQIERMIAVRVPASCNEVQMHEVSSATHHLHADLGNTTSAVGLLPHFPTVRRDSNSVLISGMRAVQVLSRAAALLILK